ncbi:hypothetical protein AQUSIP_21760 [Aquicella siphonis]|uniref:Uncharacterized protein n=1 Tax=Aquicella siphonis TaxID=254247 RepID=A0A5E4PIH2_9COXI|nr:hypothetical protein [Aquicella siphonis]VVC76849.1 hypothetical protein AQUSIP_21760 [Aquicella siphonis]
MNNRVLSSLYSPELDEQVRLEEISLLSSILDTIPKEMTELRRELQALLSAAYQASIPPIDLSHSDNEEESEEKNDDKPIKLKEIDNEIAAVIAEIEKFYPDSTVGRMIAQTRESYRQGRQGSQINPASEEENDAVIAELMDNFDFDKEDSDYFYTLPLIHTSLHSPRFRFLMHKLALLQDKRMRLKSKSIPQFEEEEPEEAPNKFMAFLNLLKKPFDIGKKFIDLIDDIWNAVGRSALPAKIVEKVAPFLVGAVGAIIHAVEGVQGLWDAIKAIRKEKSRNRKTKIAAGLLTFMLGGTGVGLSLSYIAFGLGAQVLGSALMPVLIPALLGRIYSVQLWKLSYRLHTLKDREAKAERKLNAFKIQNAQSMLTLEMDIRAITQEKKLLEEANAVILEKVQARKASDTDLERLKANDKAISTLSSRLYEKNTQLTQLKNQEARLQTKYNRLREKRLQAERDVAFKVIEITASMLVVTGVTLGATALLGAGTVATFGALPIALLVTGVVIGIGVKVFEYIDEKNNHKYSNAMRGWFADKLDRLASIFKSEPRVENSPNNRHQPGSPGISGSPQQAASPRRRPRSSSDLVLIDSHSDEKTPLLKDKKPASSTAQFFRTFNSDSPSPQLPVRPQLSSKVRAINGSEEDEILLLPDSGIDHTHSGKKKADAAKKLNLLHRSASSPSLVSHSVNSDVGASHTLH